MILNKLSNIKKRITANIIAVINIGDIRTTCVIYRVYDNNDYDLLGINDILTVGFYKGTVVDLEKASDSLSRLLNEAEKTAKARIIDVIVTAPREKSTIDIYPYTTTLNKEVQDKDIQQLLDIKAYGRGIYPNDVIISIQHSDILLDGKKVDHPIGIYTSKLSSNITIIRCFEPHIINLVNLFNYLSINLISIVHSSVSLPYLLNVEKSLVVLSIHIDANNTIISISSKSSVVFYKVVDQGVSDILKQLLQSFDIEESLLQDLEIYNIPFSEYKLNIIEFISNNNKIQVEIENINKKLDEIITHFFNNVISQIDEKYMDNLANISITGEVSNLLNLNSQFDKYINSNQMLYTRLKKEKLFLEKPLEIALYLGIIDYYLSNHTIDKAIKILGKKLKDLLY